MSVGPVAAPMDASTDTALAPLLDQVRQCARCADLPLGPRPIVQAGARARVLIAGQAPGRHTHERGRPFDDASGERLRDWLGVDEATFYDPDRFAILPMAFCYPGTGAGGDLPPPTTCAKLWRGALLERLPRVELTLLLGRHALAWHWKREGRHPPATLTEAVRDWRRNWPALAPLPHPSPRNNRWLKRNPWFAEELLPAVRQRVAELA